MGQRERHRPWVVPFLWGSQETPIPLPWEGPESGQPILTQQGLLGAAEAMPLATQGSVARTTPSGGGERHGSQTCLHTGHPQGAQNPKSGEAVPLPGLAAGIPEASPGVVTNGSQISPPAHRGGSMPCPQHTGSVQLPWRVSVTLPGDRCGQPPSPWLWGPSLPPQSKVPACTLLPRAVARRQNTSTLQEPQKGDTLVPVE